MGSQFWWIIDAVLVLIVAYVIFSNGKRGFTKVVIFCAGYVVASLAASVLSAVSAETFYDAAARGTNISAIETANSKVDFPRVFADAINAQDYGFQCTKEKVLQYITDPEHPDFDVELYHYVNRKNGSPVSEKGAFLNMLRTAFVNAYSKQIGERLPRYVQLYFRNEAQSNPEPMRELMHMLYGGKNTKGQAAEFVEDSYSRAPTTEVLQIFVYLIIFSVLMVFAALISAFMQNKLFFNITSASEHVYGGLLGVLESIAMVAVFTVVIRLIVLLTGDSLTLINERTIENTRLFKYLYDNLGFLL